MSDQNIFNQQQSPAAPAANNATPANTQVTSDPFADLLGSIKNERGEPKYKDVQTALEALKHSQEYIPQLKSAKEETDAKLAALAAEVERLKNIEQSVKELTQHNSQPQNTPAPAITEDAVAELVNRTLTAREKKLIAENNINSVVSKMQEKFGEEAGNLFYSKAAEIGMNKEQINQLASTSPTAVFKLFGIDSAAPTPQSSGNLTPSGSINTGAIKPPVNTFIGRNPNSMLVGATTSDLTAERENSKKLVEELHNKGLSTHDLTDPKVYFKHFGKS